jgi:radical SAM protein with 4Fe4S-binding SPASM domain
MCYIRHGVGDSEVRHRELPASAWLTLARQAVDSGMVFLLLTGGEVLLRRDFFEIYEPLTRMGLILTLFSNGTLITDAVAQRLAQAPPNHTEITIYGATAATYEAVTGVPGSYARCCAGIEALRTHGIPLGLKTLLTRHNVGELGPMQQMARDWGVPFRASWLLFRRRDGVPSAVEDCRLPVLDGVDLEAADRASAGDWTEAALRQSAVGERGGFLCRAGRSAFMVTPSGEMNACVDLPQPAALPLEIGFAAAWERVQAFVDGAPPESPVCRYCADRVYCERCPAWSYLETNTLSDPVPYLCEIAQARRERHARAA